MIDFINSLLPYIDTLGIFSYAFVFLASFFESFLFVGGMIVIFVGFLASQGIFDFWDLVIVASLGAILGDTLSYYLGKKGSNFLNRFSAIEAHIKTATQFFKKHGGKSVFIGRFIGPLRSVIPLVAGISHMDAKKFFIWNVTSGILFSFLMIYLGYFLGETWYTVENWFGFMEGGILGIIICIGIWIGVRKWKKREETIVKI